MRLTRLHAQNFRNIEFTSLDVDAPAVFFLGVNGQGKTNVLEAIGMVTAMRSFRTTDSKALIRHDTPEAQLRYELTHEHEEACEVTLTLKTKGKEAHLNGDKLARLGELIGRFPTVALCADDIQLLRGSPAERRRFLDMTLAIDAPYLAALTRYHRALRQRNAALKSQPVSPATLQAFEQEMAPAAATLIQSRHTSIERMRAILQTTYAAIATTDEQPDLTYQPQRDLDTAEAWRTLWENERAQDIHYRNTRSGPQRDNFLLKLKNAPAREFASEGQQRALVVALKLAQADFFYQAIGVRPMILADDILGQLDPERQTRFWKALGSEHQVLATGTLIPPAPPQNGWKVFNVSHGTFEG